MKLTIAIIALLFVAQTSWATSATNGVPCADPNVQSQRSLELQKILDADQADRAWQVKGVQPDQKTLEKMSKNDLARRKRVGEIFGTQATQSSLGGCWCIQPIEDTFPKALRDEYRGGPNAAYTGLAYLKILNNGSSCPVAFCETNLLPSPQGTVPGFW